MLQVHLGDGDFHLRFYNYATWQDLTEQLALSDIAGAVFHF